jgi:hypothetical protein
MLHLQTVEPSTLELLKTLQQIPEFSQLRLVGGTALALQIGHRRSTDLDLFGKMDVDSNEVPAVLLKTGEPTTFLKNSAHIHIALIKGIKTDIVNYPYPWLEEINHADQWRLAGLKDIAAMKLAAITGRGTKKDFFDLYFLLKIFSLRQMIGFYEQKYPDGSVFLVLKSLAYFADAETNAMPLMMIPASWPDVKKTILTQLKEIAVSF